jgi:hypothetical protein
MSSVLRTSIMAPVAALLTATLVGALVLFFVAATRALADPGGGCNQFRGTCGVGVGGPGNPGSPGDPGSPADPGRGGRGRGGQDNVCHNTDPLHGCDPCPDNGSPAADPAACAAFGHNLFCSQLNPGRMNYTTWERYLRRVGCLGNPYTPGSPGVAAHRALALIHFAEPSGDRSPSQDQIYRGYPFTYVNLWTYYWTSSGTWKSYSATARDGNQSATVTATPSVLLFDPGDGSGSVACPGPGRPWTKADGNDPPSGGACAYRYQQVTSSPITSTQTLVWKLTWQVSGPVASLPAVFSTSTSGQLNVMQIQTVVIR